MVKKATKKATEQPRRRRKNDTESDWGGVNADLLQRLISAVTKTGGAVRFGYTKDGGAYSLGIYGDGKPYTEFCPATADVEAWIEGFAFDFE